MKKIEEIAKELEILKKENEEMKRKLSSLEGKENYVTKKKETPKKSEEVKEEGLSTKTIIGIVLIVLGAILTLSIFLAFIGIPLVIVGIILLVNSSREEKSEEKYAKDKNQKTKKLKEKIQEKQSSFELSIGIHWFAMIGILALVIGIGFFVKYAIDNGWIDHLSRLILGAAFGLVLIITGKILSNKEKYEVVGKTLIGGGIAIIYFMAYVSYHFEEYRNAIGMTLQTNIIMLILIILISLIISVYENSKLMAFEVFFLGYVTSLLSRNLEILTIVYTILLTISLVILVSYKKWSLVGVGGIFMTYATYYIWSINDKNISFSFASIFLITYFVAFTIQSIILSREKESGNVKEEKIKNVIMVLLNSFFFYILYLIQINENFPKLRGAFTLTLSIIYFILYYLSEKDEVVSSTNLYLSLLYLTLSIMIEINKNWITVLLSLELLILSIIAIKSNIKELKISSYILTIIIILKTIFYDIKLPEFSISYLLDSVRLVSFLTTIIVFYVIYFLLKDSNNEYERWIKQAYLYIAGFFLFLILIMEFNNYPLFLLSLFSAISLIYLIISGEKSEGFAYKSMFFSFLLVLLLLRYNYLKSFNKLDFTNFLSSTRLFAFVLVIATLYIIAYIYSFKKELSNSAKFISSVYSWASAILVVILIFIESSGLWTTFLLALFGIITIIIGFNIDRKSLRIQGIITLFIAIIKAFLYDTRDLSTIARTISFIILGIILIIASVLFSKYKDKVKEVI